MLCNEATRTKHTNTVYGRNAVLSAGRGGAYNDYLLTYSLEQSPSWEANHFSVSQEIPRILWNPKVHYRTPCARHLSLPSACALKVQDGFEENSSHWCEERSSGCYAANGGDFLLTFRDNLSVPSSEAKNPKAFGLSTPEDRTDRLTRNVGKKFSATRRFTTLRALFSSASRPRPEITRCYTAVTVFTHDRWATTFRQTCYEIVTAFFFMSIKTADPPNRRQHLSTKQHGVTALLHTPLHTHKLQDNRSRQARYCPQRYLCLAPTPDRALPIQLP